MTFFDPANPGALRGRARSAVRQLTGPEYQVVAGRGSIMGGAGNSNGTYTRGETRMRLFFGPAPCSDIRLVFTNTVAPPNAVEAPAPNPITVEAAIETTATYMCTFGGAGSVVIPPGGVAVSDPLPFDFDARAVAWVRTGVTVAAGQVWPRTLFRAVTGDGEYESTSTSSQIGAVGSLATPSGGQGSTGGYIPTAIIGLAHSPVPGIALRGDSIEAGTVGDNLDTATGLRGVIMRGLQLDDGAILPHTILARASDRAFWNTGNNGVMRRALLKYCTHDITNFGTNDIAGGSSLATIQTALTGGWTASKRRGLKVHQVLILPRTTSTDSWASAANQTPVANFGVGQRRDEVNAWIRAQVATGLLDGIIDLNTILEDQANPGKWATNGTANWLTSDGVHPNPNGCVVGAPGVRAVAATF